MNSACKLLLVSAAMGALLSACKKDESKSAQILDAPSLITYVPKVAESVVPLELDALARFNECWRAYNEKDEKTLKSCYEESALVEVVDHVPPRVAKGRDAILRLIQDVWTGFPDMHADAQLVLVNGKNIAAILHMAGTNEGPLMGKPATGKEVSFLAAQTATLNAKGEVVTDHHWMDQRTLQHQLGMPGMARSPSSASDWSTKIRIMASNTPREAANLVIARKMEEALRSGDQTEYLKHFADDIEFRYVADKEALHGMPAVRLGLKEWGDMVDFDSKIQSRWAAGDWVVSSSKSVVTMKKVVEGMPGSKGKKVETKQLSFAEIAHDKVKSLWIFENTAPYAEHLGDLKSAEKKMRAKPARAKAGVLAPH